MKILIMLLALITLVSCGKDPRYNYTPEQYFFDWGFVKNRFVYNTGSKTSMTAAFTIPDCLGQQVTVTIRIPHYGHLRNNCLNARILSIDADKMLTDPKYRVVSCRTEKDGISYADIEFSHMPTMLVIFDYQGF